MPFGDIEAIADLCTADNSPTWIVRVCPFCGGKHTHGAGGLGAERKKYIGNRVPHCRDMALRSGKEYSLIDSGYAYNDPLSEKHAMMRMLLRLTEPRFAPGVYFLFDENNELLYIGKSINVLGRMSGHVDKAVTTAKMYACPEERINEVEKMFIKHFMPFYNVLGGKV